MKNYKLILLTIIALSISLSAEFSVKTNIILEGEQEGYFDKLIIGISDNATSGLDINLGEKDYPPVFPMSGLHGYSIILDSVYAGKWDSYYSYIDLRPIPSFKDSVVHKILVSPVQYFQSNIIFKWSTLSNYIDSAKILDYNTNGLVVNIDMKKGNSAKIENLFTRSFNLVFWYKDISSVIDDNNQANTEILPNPCTEYLKINAEKIISNCSIYNILGNTMISEKYDRNEIEINTIRLPKGEYIIRLMFDDNSTLIKRFIKF